MAVYEISTETHEGNHTLTERIEVRPWRLGGKDHQEFLIGSGVNYFATSNILVEFIYSINDAQLFYTRNFINNVVRGPLPVPELRAALQKFKSGGSDSFGFGDMLPNTGVMVKRDRRTYEAAGEQKSYSSYRLEITADIGAGIGVDEPGVRSIEIKAGIEEPAAFSFLDQLVDEVVNVYYGRHPDPAQTPPALRQWTFARQANQLAYDRIAATFDDNYFSEPPLTRLFDRWLQDIPSGGHILDVGCGSGKPVIGRLLEKGYRVTGADLSPNMLARARQSFPDVRFVNQLATDLSFESEFDGACSFSSLLYLDPIDLSYSLYRLHRALKPGGQLFLVAFDLHPEWRGSPYNVDLEQWIWEWTYGMDEAVRALEEHGYFEVLTMQDVTTEQERERRIEEWYKEAKERYERDVQKYPDLRASAPERDKPPVLPYQYVVIARVTK